MEKEEGKKRAGEGTGDESPAMKRQRETTEAVELNDDVTVDEYCKTDAMSELLKLLDDSKEPTTSACSPPASYGMKVRFSDNPYSSALVFQYSSLYVTINGNEESCGSSFSDSGSSVMASVDMAGFTSANVKVEEGLEEVRGWLEAEGEGAWGKGKEETRGKWKVDWEWDEEQLARFLGEEWLF